MKQICNDLVWERQNLDGLVIDLAPSGWEIVTLCDGWTIKDEISHLAYFDHKARLAVTDPRAFFRHLSEDMGKIKDMAEVNGITLSKGRAMTIDKLLNWWRSEHLMLIDTLLALSPKTRLPWYGPPMSALSFATARLMETWAHGQDIYDALRQKRPVSPGLEHIAHAGVSTFSWSFSNRGITVPETLVFIELTTRFGDVWTWGDAAALEKVSGPAEDFCLVVTQRRHVDDTALSITGDTARQWMEVAQAFAGPPDSGPPAGTFPGA